MTKPTPHDVLYGWWRDALNDVRNHLPVVANPDDPRPGWFKRRLVKNGVFVPARIWMFQWVDDAGDLVGDEVLQCEVDGEYADPAEAWSWLCSNPITEAEFNHLTALRQWAAKHAPGEPYADPRKPVDWLNGVPTPNFSTKEAKT